MILYDRDLMVEYDTGHVACIVRWRCTCGAHGWWMLEDETAQDHGAAHAASHLNV